MIDFTILWKTVDLVLCHDSHKNENRGISLTDHKLFCLCWNIWLTSPNNTVDQQAKFLWTTFCGQFLLSKKSCYFFDVRVCDRYSTSFICTCLNLSGWNLTFFVLTSQECWIIILQFLHEWIFMIMIFVKKCRSSYWPEWQEICLH